MRPAIHFWGTVLGLVAGCVILVIAAQSSVQTYDQVGWCMKRDRLK